MVELLHTCSGYLIYPLLALFFSWGLTYCCIRLLPKLGYVDQPGGRHIHKQLIPRGGGLAVFLAFFLGFGLYLLHGGMTEVTTAHFCRLFLPALVLAGLGMVDDRFDLPAWFKLGIQLVVAFLVWYMNKPAFSLFGWILPWYCSLAISTVWMIIIINAFNLIDGLDGLAAGLSVISASCMAIWFLLIGGHSPQLITMLIFIGACLGFLRYNFHPARIFLGDTGSTFLGLIFAVTGLSTVDRAVTLTSLLLPLLVIGVPLFDVFLAIWRRGMRKLINPEAGGIMEGDQDHLHHRLLRQTKSQTKTACVMYLIAIGFAGLALLIVVLRNAAPAIGFLIFVVGILVALRQLAVIELYDSVRWMHSGLLKPRRGYLVNFVHPFIDLAALSIAFVSVTWIVHGEVGSLSVFLAVVAPVELFLYASGVYHIYWFRVGLRDYGRLMLALSVGFLISLTILIFWVFPNLSPAMPRRLFLGAALASFLLAAVMISLERFILHYAEAFWFRTIWLQNQNPDALCRVLIYGGGLNCHLYLDYLYCSKRSAEISERIVGIADEDKVLRGMNVYGFKVLGGAEEIEQIYQQKPFDKLVVASCSSGEQLRLLYDFCRVKNIRFCRFAVDEVDVPESEVIEQQRADAAAAAAAPEVLSDDAAAEEAETEK